MKNRFKIRAIGHETDNQMFPSLDLLTKQIKVMTGDIAIEFMRKSGVKSVDYITISKDGIFDSYTKKEYSLSILNQKADGFY